MIHDDLAQIAEDLRKLGEDASYEIVYGPHGGLEGLNVDQDFFPRWELALLENQEALAKFDFAAIKARRGPDWSVEPPPKRMAAQSE
jgi:hypothetical protein